jgi:hypothetical protein
MQYERVSFSVREFCLRNGMSLSKAYTEIKNKRLRARKRGRSTIITAEDERAYNEALPVLDPDKPSRDVDIARHARLGRDAATAAPAEST